VKVFEKEKQAVDKLTQLLNDSGTSIAATTLRNWITTLTNADRILATTQLNEAISANGNASAIAQAQLFLAAGDIAVAAGDNSGGIQNYKNTWKQAMLAVGKPPDGGDDPDDH
jgi:hypothetical protein